MRVMQGGIVWGCKEARVGQNRKREGDTLWLDDMMCSGPLLIFFPFPLALSLFSFLFVLSFLARAKGDDRTIDVHAQHRHTLSPSLFPLSFVLG